MRVFVAGATGALGQPLLRELRERGDSVVGLTRSVARRPLIESLGAEAAVADALDPDGLRRAVVVFVAHVAVLPGVVGGPESTSHRRAAPAESRPARGSNRPRAVQT